MQARSLLFLLETVSWRFSRHHWLLTGFTVSGIALGVAVFLSIQLTNQSVLQAFRQGINALADEHALEISRTNDQPLPDALLQRLQPALWPLAAEISPVSETAALIVSRDGVASKGDAQKGDAQKGDAQTERPSDVIRLYATNLLTRRSQEQPWSSELSDDPFAIFQPNHVYVTQSLARRHQLKLGGTLPVILNDQPVRLTVAGILSDSSGDGRVTDRQLVLMDIGPYQALLKQAGLADRLHVFSDRPVPLLKQALEPLLPVGYQVSAPERRADRAQQLVVAFQQNLQALGFVALLVGLFLVYNTMTIFVLQRQTMLATLRALGLTRMATARLILLESLLLGLTGSLAGIAVGYGLAQASLSGVSKTIQMVYAGQAVTGIALDPWMLVGVMGLGTGLTVLASVPAVYQAVRIPPSDTLRPSRQGVSSPQAKWPKPLLMLGLGLCGLSVVLANQPPVGVGFPLFGYLATFALFLGMAACIPAVVTAVFRLSVFRWPVMVAVAVAQCRRSLGKTSVAMASLMVGIALVLSMSVLIGSFRQTVVDWVSNTLRSDVLIEPRIRTVQKGAGLLNRETLQQIERLPQVAEVDPFVQVAVPMPQNQTAYVATGHIEVLRQRGHIQMLSGPDYKQALATIQQVPDLATGQPVPTVVSEPFATKWQVKPGDVIRQPGIGNAYPLKVVGVYRDFSNENGTVILDPKVFYGWFQPLGVTSLSVYLKPDASTDAFRAALAEALGPRRLAGLQVRTNQELRKDVLVIFDNTFGVTYALFGIALAVSALCVLITLLTLVMEAKTELTLLRFLGATRRHITQWVLTLAALLALVGYGFGTAAGLGLSAILVFVINKQSFGWSVDFQWPEAVFLLLVGSGLLLLAMLAGYWPARWIQRQLNPEVLRYV